MKILLLSIFLICPLANAAERLTNIKVKSVVVGNSSGSKDSTWLIVEGLRGHSSCQNTSNNTTLFYTKPESYLSTDKALSVFMAAKLADKEITVEYIIEQSSHDLYGFGVSECEIVRVAL